MRTKEGSAYLEGEGIPYSSQGVCSVTDDDMAHGVFEKVLEAQPLVNAT